MKPTIIIAVVLEDVHSLYQGLGEVLDALDSIPSNNDPLPPAVGNHDNSCPICGNPPEGVECVDNVCQCLNCRGIWDVGREETAGLIMPGGRLVTGPAASIMWNLREIFMT